MHECNTCSNTLVSALQQHSGACLTTTQYRAILAYLHCASKAILLLPTSASMRTRIASCSGSTTTAPLYVVCSTRLACVERLLVLVAKARLIQHALHPNSNLSHTLGWSTQLCVYRRHTNSRNKEPRLTREQHQSILTQAITGCNQHRWDLGRTYQVLPFSYLLFILLCIALSPLSRLS